MSEIRIITKIGNWYFEHIVEIAMVALFAGSIFGVIALSKHIGYW